MDQRINMSGRIHSKKVYYVDNHAFTSDKGTKNGKAKAENYCYENLINTNKIIVFDSEMEYKYYLYLLSIKAEDIEIHKEYLILNSFYSANNDYHDRIIYEADFVYKINNAVFVVDVKGFVEDTFYLKWKLFDAVYKKNNLALKVVRLKGKDYLDPNCWVELKDFKAPKKTIKKQREEILKLRQEKAQKEKEQREIERLKKRLVELNNKDKLTKREIERRNEILSILKDKGLIIQ